MAHDVFISHSTKDKPIADAACAILERNGIRCWVAPRDILPGMSWAEAISDAISESRVLLLIFSDHSNRSQQVLREVQCAVSDSVMILPFRIEDVVPSRAMRYFIGVPHWLDALTAPMERHLESLGNTLRSLLESSQFLPSAPTHTPDSSMAEGGTRAVLSSCAPPPDGLPQSAPSTRQLTQLNLQITIDRCPRVVCLYAQSIVSLGKDRSNDIVLRVLPRSVENDDMTARISRQHAELRLFGAYAEWLNLNCMNGTVVDGELLPAGATALLHNGATLSPGSVVELGCDVYAEIVPGAQELESSGPTRVNQHVSALRLRRLDSLAGFEQYVIFETRVAIGSRSNCPVLVHDSTVAQHHADVLHNAEGFEIEQVAADATTQVDGVAVTPGERIPLRPGSRLQLGSVCVDVKTHQQFGLDLPLP